MVSSRIAERAPSSDGNDKVSVDSDVAGAAPLAVAEVASSADFAGMVSRADLAGAFLADLPGAFPAEIAGMAFPAIAGVASPADLAGMAVPAVAGVASPAVLMGQSTLQLHQQRQAARASTHITSSLVLPPGSEIVAPVPIRSSSGIQPGRYVLSH